MLGSARIASRFRFNFLIWYPTSIAAAERNLGVPPQIAGFVLPLGATMNMNGTALFEGVTVLFLAQFYGVSLSIGEQITVVLICILGGIGTAGVPAGRYARGLSCPPGSL